LDKKCGKELSSKKLLIPNTEKIEKKDKSTKFLTIQVNKNPVTPQVIITSRLLPNYSNFIIA